MDLDVEIGKCDKKLGLAQLNLDKIRKVESQPNYEETIPANVRVANEEKVHDNERFLCKWMLMMIFI